MMKLILFKSKTCGPCKMFEPQILKASEETGIEYIPVDVEENNTYHFWKDLTTEDLLKKFAIRSSGILVFLLDETKEDKPTIIFDRPCPASNIIKMINNMKDAVK